MAAGILVDLDRTLVDVQTFTDYEAAVSGLAEDVLGLVADTPATEWRSATRRAMDALVALSGASRWQDVSDHIESFETTAVARSALMPGVFEFLAAVGDTPIVVVTLMGPGAARAALGRHGIDLESVLGREAIHRPKPAPDQLLAGCDLMGIEPGSAVMLGDSTWDAAAAAAAGCGFVGLTLGKPSEFPAGTRTVEWLDAELGRSLTEA